MAGKVKPSYLPTDGDSGAAQSMEPESVSRTAGRPRLNGRLRPTVPDDSLTRIPMLDLGPEIAELRDELNAAFNRVLDSGRFILGAEVEAFEHEVAEYLGVKHAIGVNSGTDALIISLRALGIGPGDEVITTPFTFFATASSILLVGAQPVFVDIEYDSFNIDPELIEAAITEHTKAIMPVHLYGRPANMTRIMEIARKHKLAVVEDAAQSFGARWYAPGVTDEADAPFTGSIGDMGAFSFYPTKNLGAYGDAGMVTTNDDDLAVLARKLRTHGSIEPYQHEMLGYNSRMDEIQAAILRVKLPHIDRWNNQRRQLAEAYAVELQNLAGVVWPNRPLGHVFHQITVRITDNRDAFIRQLYAQGILANIYYPCLANEFDGVGFEHNSLPIARNATKEVCSFPIVPNGNTASFDAICQGIRSSQLDSID